MTKSLDLSCQSEGKISLDKLSLNNLDSTVDRDDIRHPLNKDNQVHLTFRIGVVENRFD